MDSDLIEGTDIRFHIRTADIWDAMYRDCMTASRSIDFEQYILRDDAAGHRFLQLFADKAEQGVRVRLLLDTIGSRRLRASPLIDTIRRHGGHVRFYNTVTWLKWLIPFAWFPRDHCKIMVIDSRIAHIGSACMAEHMTPWRDTQARLEGALVRDIEADFEIVWRLGRRFMNPPYRMDAGKLLRYASTQPRLRTSPIYRELLHEIRRAKESVVLVTPYFLPPWHLRRALRGAVRRGVSVRIMLGEHTDVPVADYVSHSYFNGLLRDGLRILLYGRTVLHAKYAIVDEQWATIGSSNMDYLSLVRNREANLILRHQPAIARLQSHFDHDLDECREIDSSYWENASLAYKIKGYAGRILRRVL